jgi:hypothetical protein
MGEAWGGVLLNQFVPPFGESITLTGWFPSASATPIQTCAAFPGSTTTSSTWSFRPDAERLLRPGRAAVRALPHGVERPGVGRPVRREGDLVDGESVELRDARPARARVRRPEHAAPRAARRGERREHDARVRGGGLDVGDVAAERPRGLQSAGRSPDPIGAGRVLADKRVAARRPKSSVLVSGAGAKDESVDARRKESDIGFLLKDLAR